MSTHTLRLNRPKITGLLATLAYLSSGILLLARPDWMIDAAVWVLCLVLGALGVHRLVRYCLATPEAGAKGFDLAEALLLLSATLVLALRPDLFSQILPGLWVCYLILGGYMLVQTAIDFWRIRYVRWWLLLIGAGLCLLLGALAYLQPGFVARNAALFIGISLLVEAAFNGFAFVLNFLHNRGMLPTRGKPAAKPAEKPTVPPVTSPTNPEAPMPSEAPTPPERPAPATIAEELARYAEQEAKG